MVSTINDNPAAIVAVRAFIQANAGVRDAQNRVASGLDVAASDGEAVALSVDDGGRGNLRALQAVQQSVDNARGLASVSIAGATQVSDLLAQVRDVVSAAVDQGGGDDDGAAGESGERSADGDEGGGTPGTQIDTLAREIRNAIENASFNGVNLLQRGAGDQQVIADAQGGVLTLTAQDLQSAAGAALNDANLRDQLARAGEVDAQAVQAFLESLDSAANVASQAITQLRDEAQALDRQAGFLEAIQTAGQQGLGEAVNTDLASQDTRETAQQVRQLLADSGLSIANSQPDVVAGLFGNLR